MSDDPQTSRPDPRVSLLVVAAVLSGTTRTLHRAARTARTTRDRQVVVLADTHLRGDRDLLDALVREHLTTYPDHLLAAWIAGRYRPAGSRHRSSEGAPEMSVTTSPPPATARPRGGEVVRPVGRWLLSFVGFPLGGLASVLVVGPVDAIGPAAAGGLLTGTVLGVAQALGLGLAGRDRWTWTAATAAGLAVGLAAGATLVGFGTRPVDLALQGLAQGAAVGVLQAAVLLRRAGTVALLWPPLLAAAYAVGWSVTAAVGVRVDEQFTVFGAAGAVTVTVLTAFLPVVLRRTTGGAR